MLTREKTYNEIGDILDLLWRPADAKYIESANIINLNEVKSKLIFNSSSSSNFFGDVSIVAVPSEIVRLYSELKVYKEIDENPLLESREEDISIIQDRIDNYTIRESDSYYVWLWEGNDFRGVHFCEKLNEVRELLY